MPDLSFGTHFFQDLVESQIRYLPLYPDDDGIIFNYKFLNNSFNILPDILPEFAHLHKVVKVIDVPNSSYGMTMKVLMNADLDEAVAILSPPLARQTWEDDEKKQTESRSDDAWRWRYRMAEKIASLIDTEKFGVKSFYLFGSTKNATAGPASDIDIIIHCNGNEKQMEELKLWLSGWSYCLSEMNYLRTGYKTESLLDVHLITDEDIKNKDSYAMKIGAITDAAKELHVNRD